MPDVWEKGTEEYRWAVTRVLLAERMHWTLDYIDNMPDVDLLDTLTVLGKTGDAREAMRRKK